MMNLSFEGKVVLVTGASTGIGRAISKGFADSGAKVVVNFNRSSEQAHSLIREIVANGGEAFAVQADVSKSSDVETLFDKVLSTYGKIDILVNNAGSLIRRCKIEEMPEELWDEILDVNTKSVFLCSRKVIPILKLQGSGRIINVSSQAARNGGGNGSVPYATAKGAVSTFTKGLAKELAPYHILVNGIAPGVIATPFHDRFTPADQRARNLVGIPMGREGNPDECVGAVLFLASDASNYITGEMIEVNGGSLMD